MLGRRGSVGEFERSEECRCGRLIWDLDLTFISGNTVESVRLHRSAPISSLNTLLTGPTMVVTDECGSGHESAGEIVEVGEGVTQWQVGDRVAIEAGVPCASCDACRSGRYNACESRLTRRGECTLTSVGRPECGVLQYAAVPRYLDTMVSPLRRPCKPVLTPD